MFPMLAVTADVMARPIWTGLINEKLAFYLPVAVDLVQTVA